MLLTLQEDRVLRVYDTVEGVVRDVEALDADDVLREVFDEDCRWYRIKWIEANRTSSSLGIQSFENGKYTLIPDGNRDPERALSIIRGAAFVEPPAAETLVREMAARLSRS